MRIAIMGTGAVGGYFGGMLAHAGNEVTFIARGEQLQALRNKGLVLETPRGRIALEQVKATDKPAEIEPVDVVLFCVKTYDTEDSARAIAPCLKPGGVCISLQNGVDSQDRIGAVLGEARVMGGIAFVSGVIESPGVMRYVSPMSMIRYGEHDGSESERARAFQSACLAAGFGAEIVPDIRAAQWDKFVALATNAALCSLVRAPAGVIYHQPELAEVARAAFAEVADVARALDIKLQPDVVEKSFAIHKKFPPGMYASMYWDIARGRRMELESFSGLVVRKGKETGVPTPVHGMAYACLLPFVNGTPEILRQSAR